MKQLGSNCECSTKRFLYTLPGRDPPVYLLCVIQHNLRYMIRSSSVIIYVMFKFVVCDV